MNNLILAALFAVSAVLAADAKPDRELTVVNIEVKGVKIWIPNQIIVKKGERVRLTLVNTAPSGVHSFAIKQFGVEAQVDNKAMESKKIVEFVADKAGLFPTQCTMHPAHVTGQLLVLD